MAGSIFDHLQQVFDGELDKVATSITFSIGNLASSVIKIVRERTLSGISAEATQLLYYGQQYQKKKGTWKPNLYDIPPRKWGGEPYSGVHMLDDLEASGSSGVEFDVTGTGSKIRGAGGRWVAARDVEISIQPRSDRSKILARIHESGNYGRGPRKPRPWLGLTVQEADELSAAVGRDLHQIQFSDALDIKFEV